MKWNLGKTETETLFLRENFKIDARKARIGRSARRSSTLDARPQPSALATLATMSDCHRSSIQVNPLPRRPSFIASSPSIPRPSSLAHRRLFATLWPFACRPSSLAARRFVPLVGHLLFARHSLKTDRLPSSLLAFALEIKRSVAC